MLLLPCTGLLYAVNIMQTRRRCIGRGRGSRIPALIRTTTAVSVTTTARGLINYIGLGHSLCPAANNRRLRSYRGCSLAYTVRSYVYGE